MLGFRMRVTARVRVIVRVMVGDRLGLVDQLREGAISSFNRKR